MVNQYEACKPPCQMGTRTAAHAYMRGTVRLLEGYQVTPRYPELETAGQRRYGSAEHQVGLRKELANVSRHETSSRKRLAHTDLTTLRATGGCETVPGI